tara:strand:- start:171 stop:1139 length:969 start_codon:yes stop_codon:yes gene_type:complete
MDYINYVKQSPVQGLTGLWGGTQGALQASAGGGTSLLYAGGRALCSTYGSPGSISYWSLDTTSNAGNFGTIPGNMSNNNGAFCGSDASRAVWGGGPSENAMAYVTTTSTGNASTFGSLTRVRYAPAGCSNGVRGLLGGGYPPDTNTIDYVTVATTGSASHFGNRTQSRHGIDAISGGVRGIFANGQDPHSSRIDYVTIDTTGDATDFGSTTVARTHGTGTNSDPGSGQNRGVFVAGYSGVDDHCDYITCASTGNATDWGELANSHSYRCGAGTNGLRGYCAGGEGAGTANISYMTIDTTGSSSNAGDLVSSGASQGTSGVAS